MKKILISYNEMLPPRAVGEPGVSSESLGAILQEMAPPPALLSPVEEFEDFSLETIFNEMAPPPQLLSPIRDYSEVKAEKLVIDLCGTSPRPEDKIPEESQGRASAFLNWKLARVDFEEEPIGRRVEGLRRTII